MAESSTTKVWTVLTILRWTSEYFERHSVDSPRLTAELMLCDVLQVGRLNLYVDFERLLSADELAAFRHMIERRVKHREPLQYILGTTNFYGCNLSLNHSVLIPRPETELLAERAIEYIKANDVREVLDIGTGSGCIAIAVAKNCPQVHITALDISSAALECARGNAEQNNIRSIDFVEADILNEWTPSTAFDLVLSNPPYISLSDYQTLEPELLRHEPRQALTDEKDGTVFYRKFAQIFPKLLTKGGVFFVEIGYQSSEDVTTILLAFDPRTHKDYSGIDRIVEGHVT